MLGKAVSFGVGSIAGFGISSVTCALTHYVAVNAWFRTKRTKVEKEAAKRRDKEEWDDVKKMSQTNSAANAVVGTVAAGTIKIASDVLDPGEDGGIYRFLLFDIPFFAFSLGVVAASTFIGGYYGMHKIPQWMGSGQQTIESIESFEKLIG